MSELHRAYLSLGSNIEPEINLCRAVDLLRRQGEVHEISSAWESRSVGFPGPNFLNLCLCYSTALPPRELKEEVIRPIEAKLGRVRHAEKNAPRTIDIDIVLFDDKPLNTDFWEYAFVAVPLAELLPDFIHPIRGERLAQVAEQLRSQVWIKRREDVIIS